MGGDPRTEHTDAVSTTSFARSSPSSSTLSLPPCSSSTTCSPLCGAAMRASDGTGVNPALGFVVPTKPLHRIRRITVCLLPRPRLLANKKIGSVLEMNTGNVSVFSTMLGPAVITCPSVTPRRLLDDSHLFFYEKVDSNPVDNPLSTALTRQPRKSCQPVVLRSARGTELAPRVIPARCH